jgi:hypothetical protein
MINILKRKVEKNMKIISLYLLFVIPFMMIVLPGYAKTPLEVVNTRMEAHNNHNLEKFLETYADDIMIYDYPNTPLGKGGREHIRNIFAPLFKEKSVKTEIHHQIANGKYVVNHETVTREGKTTEYVSIYEVENGLIKSVRFIK